MSINIVSFCGSGKGICPIKKKEKAEVIAVD
jgi:hypothetical protein